MGSVDLGSGCLCRNVVFGVVKIIDFLCVEGNEDGEDCTGAVARRCTYQRRLG